MLIYNPLATRHPAAQKLRSRLDSLRGKVIGFIDNSKPNFNHLVDDLANVLNARYGVAAVVKRSKRTSMRPAPDAVLRELLDHCDVVIAGSGD